jgi:hypothetical protein
MVLPNGARIEGRALIVQPEALIIKITKTSDKIVQPKGEISIPRTAIPVLQVVKYGIRWRIFGTAIGAALGVLIAPKSGAEVRADVREAAERSAETFRKARA